jgi:hypothetical protein
MMSRLAKMFGVAALAVSAIVPAAQAADFDPVVQYSDWAFRFEGAAGYTDVELGFDAEFQVGDFPVDIGGTAGIDGPIINSAFSASFQGPVLWTQLDGVFGLSHYHANGNSASYTQFSGGAHIGWRDMNTGMFALNVAATGFNFVDANVDFLRVGGTGELYFNQFTVGASGGFITDLVNASPENGYVKGLARWYINDNLKFEGHGGAIFAENDVELIYGRALLEWKPDDSRISYFARWDGFFIDETRGPVSINVDSHAAVAGIRIYFGDPATTTVKEQDRVHFADSCAFGAAGQLISIC